MTIEAIEVLIPKVSVRCQRKVVAPVFEPLQIVLRRP